MTARTIPQLADAGLIHPSWVDALVPVQPQLTRLGEFLRQEEASGRPYLPAGAAVLRAFQAPLADVRVLLLGQDPYPTPGHPVGLAFSVERRVRPLPRSLVNVFRELRDDLSVSPPPHGDLSAWSERGVLLLNRVLTVRAGVSGSHRGRGWEAVTDAALRAVAGRRVPLVALLWGRDAQAVRPLLGDTAVVASAHPSPLSAAAGFFGSRPFSRCNVLLRNQGADPVDWRLD